MERLASDAPVNTDVALACALLEARLRDGLRAPALDIAEILDAASAARSRGVEVLLLDDGGFEAIRGPGRRRIIDTVVDQLRHAESGTVTVVHRRGDHIERLELDGDGNVAH